MLVGVPPWCEQSTIKHSMPVHASPPAPPSKSPCGRLPPPQAAARRRASKDVRMARCYSVSTMRVVTINCLQDNYAYLVIDGTEAAVVDPGEAGPVKAALEREGVSLRAIWLTHHHHDHVGGVPELAGPGIEVVAHTRDVSRAPGVTRPVEEGDVVSLGRLRAHILHNPGHTLGAISYVVE